MTWDYNETLEKCGIRSIDYKSIYVDGAFVGFYQHIGPAHSYEFLCIKIDEREYLVDSDYSDYKRHRGPNRKKTYVFEICMNTLLVKDGEEITEQERNFIKKAIVEHYVRKKEVEVDFHEDLEGQKTVNTISSKDEVPEEWAYGGVIRERSYSERLESYNINDITYDPIQVDGEQVGISTDYKFMYLELNGRNFLIECRFSHETKDHGDVRKSAYAWHVDMPSILVKDGSDISEEEKTIIKKAIKQRYEKQDSSHVHEVVFHE